LIQINDGSQQALSALCEVTKGTAMTDLPSTSARSRLSDWWNDRQFTKRQGRIYASAFSAISVFLTFALAVFLSR